MSRVYQGDSNVMFTIGAKEIVLTEEEEQQLGELLVIDNIKVSEMAEKIKFLEGQVDAKNDHLEKLESRLEDAEMDRKKHDRTINKIEELLYELKE